MDHSQNRQIWLIAPTEELLRRSQQLVQEHHFPIGVVKASLGDALAVGENLIKAGARLFISRRGTKKILEAQFAVPIVEIGTTLADYVEALKKATEVPGKVAFFSYERIPADVKTACSLQHIQALYYPFSSLEQCAETVAAAVKAGAVLGVGGADSAFFSANAGLEHIIIENSVDSLLLAMETALQWLEVQKNEEKKQKALKLQLERYRLVLNYTHDAVLSINSQGRLDLLNERARVLLGNPEGKDSRRLEEAIREVRMLEILHGGKPRLGELHYLAGKLVSANLLPIKVEGNILGAVGIFQDVKKLQAQEQKIRIQLHKKGLTAKYHFDDIKGCSRQIQDTISLAEQFSRTDATILIQGETGTGKELFAQSIHNASRRSGGPFVAVNCGAFPRDLLESELFGYVEGAFTGASRGGKKGLFEMAHQGTIFLDEIGEMPVSTQVQLLRVLQEKEIRRLGSDTVTPVDIRIIAATNRNLLEEIQEKKFRADLYYRLNVLNLYLPPLRERQKDVFLLGMEIFNQFWPESDTNSQKTVCEILENLKEYSWPGNVRELSNLMERLSLLLQQGSGADFIRRYLLQSLQQIREMDRKPHGSELIEWEREQILGVLKKNNLDLAKTAEDLGCSRSTLWRKMKKYNIENK